MKYAPSYYEWAWLDAGRKQRRMDYLTLMCHQISATLWPNAKKQA